MTRLILLELHKLAKPVLTVLALLTAVTCVLCCTLFRDYTLCYALDKWEIGTEFLPLLFSLIVTVPVCWQLYYERRDRFLVYTLPRISKGGYLAAKWTACAISAFALLFVPYVLSGLTALYLAPNAELHPEWVRPYYHIFLTWYTKYPLVYLFVLSLWKGLLGVLTMTFGFVLALFSSNLFVVLTAPFVYALLDNFLWSALRIPNCFLAAFEPYKFGSSLTVQHWLWGPIQLTLVICLTVLYYTRLRRRSIYPL